MKIKVTQEDIENGIREKNDCCPIALAIKREFKIEYDLKVLYTYTYIVGKVYYLPKKARKFIIDFDRGKKRKPFEFELEKQELKIK